MSSIRAWIVVLAVTSFLAGLAAGLWLAPSRGSRDADPYVARMQDAFDLDEKRVHWLRTALADYEAEVAALKSRDLAPLEAELVQAGKRCHDRIRDYVIPAERREEFDRLSGGQPLFTGALR